MEIFKSLAVILVIMASFSYVGYVMSEEHTPPSIYCEDGSLCVPEGEAEPECE